MMEIAPQVFLIEPDDELRFLMAELLGVARIPVTSIDIIHFRKGVIPEIRSSDIIVLSERVPEMELRDSILLLKKLLSESFDSTQIFLSTRDPQSIQEHFELGQLNFQFNFLEIPFDPKEFISNIHKLFESKKEASIVALTDADVGRISYGSIVLDQKNFDAYCNHRRVSLTPSEFSLLQAFVSAPGKVYSRDELLNWVQEKGIVVVDRVIDTHVFGLRKKMQECGQMIQTIRGIGYCLKTHMAP